MEPALRPVPDVRPPAPAADEEAGWVAEALRGDRAAFDRLALAAMPVLLGSARRLLADRHAAEEVVAEALFLAWRRLDGFRGESRFSTWVHRILFRAVADRVKAEIRERNRRRRLAEQPVRRMSASPTGDASAREAQARLRRATEQLPPTQRLVLLLVAWEGLSLQETADILGMRYRTAKSNLHHARTSLRRWMEEGGRS